MGDDTDGGHLGASTALRDGDDSAYACEWEATRAWLRSDGVHTDGRPPPPEPPQGQLGADNNTHVDKHRGPRLVGRTNVPPSSAPSARIGACALTDEQRARIHAKREEALAKKRRLEGAYVSRRLDGFQSEVAVKGTPVSPARASPLEARSRVAASALRSAITSDPLAEHQHDSHLDHPVTGAETPGGHPPIVITQLCVDEGRGGGETPGGTTSAASGLHQPPAPSTGSPFNAYAPPSHPPPSLSPPSPVRRLIDEDPRLLSPPRSRDSCPRTASTSRAVHQPWAAPPSATPARPFRHKRRAFAAALDAALAASGDGDAGRDHRGRGVTFDDGAVLDDGAHSCAARGTRPSWLTRPTDAAGLRRPIGPHRSELRDAGSTGGFDPATLHIPQDALRAMTPFNRQFWGIKSRLMDCVVMCRHGSFYNMFDVDSQVGMGVGLRVSGKPAAFMQKVGCHHKDFDAWAAKMLGQGWSVARVEETGDRTSDEAGGGGGGGGGIIRREVVEILTPALDRGLTRDPSATFLLALAEEKPPPRETPEGSAGDETHAHAALPAGFEPDTSECVLGAALIDASTGEIMVGSFRDGPTRDALGSLLAATEPREVVVSRARPSGALSAATLAALRGHARCYAASGSCTLREIERGADPTPAFTPADTLAALAHFGGIPSPDDTTHACTGAELGADSRARLPRALDEASAVAMEALAYAVRHVAWAGAAPSVLCQGKFRRLVVGGCGSEPSGVSEPSRAASVPSSTSSGERPRGRSTRDDAATGQTDPHTRVVRLDASTVQSLHLLRGDDLSAHGDASAGSLLAFLDATVTAPGRRRLREWLTQPLRLATDISRRHDALDALLDPSSPNTLGDVRAGLGSVVTDAQRGVQRAVALAEACTRAVEAAVEHGAAPPCDEDDVRLASVLSGLGGSIGAATSAATSVRRRRRAADADWWTEEAEEVDATGEAAVAFWSPRGKEVHGFVGVLDAVVGLAETLSGLPNAACVRSSLLRECRELGEATLPDARHLRGRLMLTAEVAGLSGAGTNALIRNEHQKKRKSGGRTGGRFAFEGALAGLAAVPAPGVSDAFDGAVRVVIDSREDPRDDVAAAEATASAAAARFLSGVVAGFAAGRHRWRALVSAAADLDVLHAFALRTGPRSPALPVAGPGARFCRPVFLDDPEAEASNRGAVTRQPNRLQLRESWHPLAVKAGKAFVRNDVVLGDPGPGWERGGEERGSSGEGLPSRPVMILTGPNMGGKSTLLRQVALSVVLAQIGCYVPAATARMHPVDGVACRVGAGDGIAAGVSTFLAEMSDTSSALRRATPRTLLIVDELGRGTSTADGYAIAYAVLRAVASMGARCLFATHYHGLARDVGPTRGAAVAHMTADAVRRRVEERDTPPGWTHHPEEVHFRYRLAPGPAPLGSCAMNVARIAGFPLRLLRRAARVADAMRVGGGGRGEGESESKSDASRRCRPSRRADDDPPVVTLSDEALRCARALATDPVVGAVPGAVGDDAWAGGFFALWQRCGRLR